MSSSLDGFNTHFFNLNQASALQTSSQSDYNVGNLFLPQNIHFNQHSNSVCGILCFPAREADSDIHSGNSYQYWLFIACLFNFLRQLSWSKLWQCSRSPMSHLLDWVSLMITRTLGNISHLWVFIILNPHVEMLKTWGTQDNPTQGAWPPVTCWPGLTVDRENGDSLVPLTRNWPYFLSSGLPQPLET